MLLLLLQAHRAKYGNIAGALLSTKQCRLRVQYAAFHLMYLHSNLKGLEESQAQMMSEIDDMKKQMEVSTHNSTTQQTPRRSFPPLPPLL